MKTTLITNAHLITWEQPNQILSDSAVAIQNGLIIEFGKNQDLIAKYPESEFIDAGNQFVMPGNICSHTHFYGAFARGLSTPGAAAKDFPEILTRLWWPLDKSLTREDIYYSVLVCVADAIRNGTTTLIDHHASPNAISGSLDTIAQAVGEGGLRAVLCYEVTDRDGEDKAKEGIQENERFIRLVKGQVKQDGMLGAMFGLHASLTLSDNTLRACRQAFEKTGVETGFHIHVAESNADETDSIAKSGTRVVDRLASFGILGPRSIAAHCVHVDAREIHLLAETETWVSHQPRSNMNNAVGLPQVESMLRAGIKVCLGNDGFSNAQWEEWKAAYLGHKLTSLDPRRMSAVDIAQMAVVNNAALAEQFIPGARLGRIEKGARADLVFVDYHPFTPLSEENLPWHIVFGFQESMITTTIVGGKILMRNRVLLTLDEDRIASEALKHASRVWERYGIQLKRFSPA